MVGNDGDAFLGVAAIIDKNAGEHAARLTLANADGQVLIERGKAAGLQNVGEHVGGDLGVPLLDAAHAVGRQVGRDEGNHDRHHAGGIEERKEQPERREARRIHHDDLGVGRELVEGMRDRDHQRDRRNDQHQRRDDEAGDAEKGDDGLTLARHQVDAAQRLRNPDHPCQAHQNQRKRRKRRSKNILVDRPHRYRTIPTWRAETAAHDQSRNRDPHWSCRSCPAGSHSHYHPFDPSTKWLRHGTLAIWLIIRPMWLMSHGALGSAAADRP